MSSRITIKYLEIACERLNKTARTTADTEFVIAPSYNKYQLQQRKGKGIETRTGLCSPRELYEWIHAYTEGMCYIIEHPIKD